jgi:shikimate kinase
MKVFLLGLPGSGKSTLGRQVAAELKIPFVDLDHEIVRREGRPIPEIFKEKKEDYFRQLESDVLKMWAAKPNEFVMATGGGAPCFLDGITVINNAGTSVFLDVPPTEIARRMERTRVENRPTIAPGVNSLREHIETMLANRTKYYRQAHHVLAGDRITAAQILTAIRPRS